MSVFSDTLTRYIEHKNIKVFSLAKYCNLDRSTMYKILNGKRNPPSSEVFEKMTQFMHLTPIEYKLLCLLSRNVGKVLTHTYITQQIWGRCSENDVASLRVFMATLRKKLEPEKNGIQYIQTHIGIGYRMLRIEKNKF